MALVGPSSGTASNPGLAAIARIFLSYRRNDRPGFAGRLAEALEAAFGPGSVFRDVDDIRPGEDFGAVIQRELEAAVAVLVLIGPNWLERDADGRLRLADPEDFVRQELARALRLGKPVIPVLVSGAEMPRRQDLPAPLDALALRQAIRLADGTWRADVAGLLEVLRPLVSARRGGRGWRRLPGTAGAALALTTLAALLLARLLAPPPPEPGKPAVAERPVADGPAPRGTAPALPPPAERTSAATEGTGMTSAGPADPGAPEPETTASLAGRWLARVRYDWGAEYEEVFEFRFFAGELRGTASYLGVPRIIEAGSLQGGALRFTTRTQQLQGDAPPRELTHRYEGSVSTGTIQFTLESLGGHSSSLPVRFEARREKRV